MAALPFLRLSCGPSCMLSSPAGPICSWFDANAVDPTEARNVESLHIFTADNPVVQSVCATQRRTGN
jgi:hypothetical protein